MPEGADSGHAHDPAPAPMGYLLVDKPVGPSSHSAVQRVRRTLGIGGRRGTRAGHAGTLDPFASGLLLVLVGRATRLMPHVVGHDKRYLLEVTFGARSDTDDATGTLEPDQRPLPDEEAVRAGLATLAAATEQVPPAVSAIHVDGVRAYRRVRRGEVVEVPPRPVRIDAAELVGVELVAGAVARATVDVACASGTYMRSLARDLGELVGCAAHASALRRTAIGELHVDDAIAPDEATLADVRDPAPLVADLASATLQQGEVGAFAGGRRVRPARLGDGVGTGDEVAVQRPDGSLAGIAEAVAEEGATAGSMVLQPRTVLVEQPPAGVTGAGWHG